MTGREEETTGSGAAGGTTRSSFSLGASPSGPRSFAEPPTLEIPSGGGSLRGMGEALTPVSLHGTAGFEVPLRAPDGRRLQPDLALRYSSGEGNGPFGLGWSLGLPAVRLRTDRGVPEYAGGDTAFLDGADDLVRVSRGERPAPWGGSGPPVVTDRYRPRTETQYARIERHTRADGSVFWSVLDSTDVLSVFGRSASARIADPGDPARVAVWLLEDVFDGAGERMHYRWVSDDRSGVPRTVSEAHRAEPAQRVLSEILYLVRDPVPDRFAAAPIDHSGAGWRAPFHRALAFDHGERADGLLEGSGTWTARPDRFSDHRSGFEVRTQRRCSRVLGFQRNVDEVEWTLVGATELTYADRPTSSLLVRARYRGSAADGSERALPPLDFEYTPSSAPGPVRPVDSACLADAPAGTRHGVQWADLDAVGAPGLLSASEVAWSFASNLGDGRFAASRTVSSAPAGAVRVGAMFGDGRLVATTADGAVRYAVRDPLTREWNTWYDFDAVPVGSGGRRLSIDLEGDGLAEAVEHRGDTIAWNRFLGPEGFAPERRRVLADDGPRVALDDPTAAVLSADLTGDGLDDLVVVRSDSVVYWPALGHGRFAGPVVTEHPPELGGRFDPRRVLLGDTDGSGPCDLLYLGDDGVRCWQNLSGNGWGPSRLIDTSVLATEVDSVELVDVLGSGTACLVISSDLPGGPPMRMVELCPDGKPDLLRRATNGRGREVVLGYSTSAREAVAARAAGRPWSTPLPVPVHVVAETVESDLVTGVRTRRSYGYRDGYFDTDDREFRGFARVDTTQHDDVGDGRLSTSISWYRTGAPTATAPDGALRDRFEGGAQSHYREALRALRGTLVRTAVYALDDGERAHRPYAVTEVSRRVRVLAEGDAGGVVCAALPAETLAWTVERVPCPPGFHHPEHRVLAETVDPLDPMRVRYEAVTRVSDLGRVERSVAIAWGRTDGGAHETQRTGAVLVVESDAVDRLDDPAVLVVAAAVEERVFELIGAPVPAVPPGDAFLSLVETAPMIAPDAAAPAGPARRLLTATRTRYWDDALDGELPQGEVGRRGYARRELDAALTAGQAAFFEPLLGSGTLTAEGGYRVEDGPGGPLLWAPGGVVRPDRDRFLLPVAFVDAFGRGTFVEYDALSRLPAAVLATLSTDDLRPDPAAPAWNRVRAHWDERCSLPRRLVDPHGTVTEAEYDALGMLVRSRVRGENGEGGPADSWDAEHSVDLGPFVSAPLRVEVTRRVSDTERIRSVSHLDGHGREVLVKVQAEAGPSSFYSVDGSLARTPDGRPERRETDGRWVGTGRAVFDGAGRPVSRFDPYFAPDERYDVDPALVQQGAPAQLHYDPLGRPVRIVFADGSFERTTYAPWSVVVEDRSDTVLESDWYAARDPAAPEAVASAAHAGTPSTTLLDALGRGTVAVEILGTTAGRRVLSTTLRHDVQGRVVAVVDPRGATVLERTLDLLGRPLREASADSGDSRVASDAAGRVLRAWAGVGVWPDAELESRIVRDGLGRERELWHTEHGAARCSVVTLYGDEDPVSGRARRVLGLADRVLDGSGLATVKRCDERGRPIETARRFAVDATARPDWSAAAAAPDAVSAAAGLLEAGEAVSRTTTDALGRVVSATAPDGSVIATRYTPRDQVASVTVTTPGDAPLTVLDTARYDAHGRRELVRCGPGGGAAETQWHVDPLTQRVVEVTSTGAATTLQRLTIRYDVRGIVIGVTDAAVPTRFFANSVVTADREYRSDSLGRLVEATGREAPGTDHTTADSRRHPGLRDLPDPDGDVVVRYRERYDHDDSGSLVRITHVQEVLGGASWTREIAAEASANRVSATIVGGASEPVSTDRRGRITRLGARELTWGAADVLERAVVSGSLTAHYRVDAAGHRTRTLLVAAGRREERRIVGALETVSVRSGGGPPAEESALRIDAGGAVTAVLERSYRDDGVVARRVVRYQLPDHLGSASIEVDDAGAPLTREEFHPWGTTAYASARPGAGRKRYRFLARECDDETGLARLGERLLVPWLGRWASADPAGISDGTNRFAYARGAPHTRTDGNGRQSVGADDLVLQGIVTIDGVRYRQYSTFAGDFVLQERVDPEPRPGAQPAAATAPAPEAGARPLPPPPTPEPPVDPETEEEDSGPEAAPQDPEEQDAPWRESLPVQVAVGLLVGVGEGVMPFGADADLVATETGVVSRGTRAAQVSKGVGQIIGGFYLGVSSVGGAFVGTGLSFTGAGAAIGVPVVAVSAAVAVGGLGNVVAGAATIAGAYKSPWKGVEDLGTAVSKTRGGLVGKAEKHHVFPDKERKWFASKGIAIDEYTLKIDRETHKVIHGKGKHLEDFRRSFQTWIDAHRGASEQEIFAQAGRLMDEYGLSLGSGPFVRY
ncbi:RHS repeat-associated core domain-containing protein [Rathayibacter oskolensis]|uniref:RHS repeat-associated core domain-containing protein n=1 Tax=Rathayibacter oskolensis TaxID=1891671 RepID=A0A1X7NJT5_9MICO|nr:SpvB/TcaC N-terminal domain-containing protein [Rathayibacter oskolensis]SMH38156.1 RHS repeat-associated core domain-containing protein [Rathayibacter oskolensis]